MKHYIFFPDLLLTLTEHPVYYLLQVTKSNLSVTFSIYLAENKNQEKNCLLFTLLILLNPVFDFGIDSDYCTMTDNYYSIENVGEVKNSLKSETTEFRGN